VAALHGFFDGAGTEPSKPFACVAGYIFTLDGAKECDCRWRIACRNVPTGIVFSMSDLWRREKPFLGWTVDQRDQLATELAGIIAETALAGVAVGIERATLKSVIAESPDIAAFLGGEYSICVQGAMNLAGGALDTIGDDRMIAYFFEDGDTGNAEARVLLGQIALNEDLARRYRRYSDSFVPKGSNGALGAADFLAWEWQNLYKSPAGGGFFPTLMRVIESRVRHFRIGYSRNNIILQGITNQSRGIRLL
jgi:hypothetical protein